MTAPASLDRPKERYGQAFLYALLVAAVLFLPFLIYDRGYFIYYGDFNVQQIPFYQMAHDSVRSGDIFWNWYTDLGANFIGSYSFYLLGSPFFWLTLLFPSAAVPYLMAPLLILKFACSSLTAYAYMRRFVHPDYAMIGGLLYAFSGFSIYNVFFNHFHEAIVYFPLMLLGLERYMKDGKRGLFGLSVLLSALSNYYFFIGQAIFLVIYWFVRLLSGDWTCSAGKFGWLLFEAVVGTAGAAVLLLPSFYAVIQNPRTENLLAGWDFLYYDKPQRLFDILHSFFFPQDIPARENFFPDSDNKWSSMSAWLPIFGCSGAIAYFQSRRHTDWLRRMLVIGFFCAVIPGLNALFQLFNWVYYARWYYMLVLLLALATVKCFAEAAETPVEWKHAFGWSFGVTAFFALFVGFMPKSWTPSEETGLLELGLMKDPGRFWVTVAIAVVCLVLACLLVLLFRQEKMLFFRWTLGVLTCVCVVVGWYLLGLGKANSNYTSGFVIERGIEGADKITLPDGDETVRVDMNEGMDNQGMFWRLPSINAFHSIVPGSVMEFYPTIGIDRGVATRPESRHYAVRSLLSTRWLFDYANDKGLEWKDDEDYFDQGGVTKMPGWTFYDKQNGFLIYENQYYVPMGFTYDYQLTRSDYDDLPENQRELALLKALVLEDTDAAELADLLPPLTADAAGDYSQQTYFADCLARRAAAADSFTRDSRGFTATIALEEDNLVFFSVPYEDGWSATVNGQPAPIYKVNVGFMAVKCPAGEMVTIRFDYMTPGLLYGLLISGAAAVLLLLYFLLMTWFDRRRRRRLDREFGPLGATPDTARGGGMDVEEYRPPDYLDAPSPVVRMKTAEPSAPAPAPATPPTPPPSVLPIPEEAPPQPPRFAVPPAVPIPSAPIAPPQDAESADDGFDLYKFYPGSRPSEEDGQTS